MSTHLDSGAFPALGIRDSSPRGTARKTPAPWDVRGRPPSEPMLAAPVRVVRPPPVRARGSATNLRVVSEASGPHVAADDWGAPVVSARTWWAFQASLFAASILAVFTL